MIERSIPWIVRIAWLAVAIVGGAAVTAALDGRSEAVGAVATIGGWVVWGSVALALLIPSVRSLTAIRLLTPVALVAVPLCAAAGAAAGETIALLVPALVAVLAAFTAEFGRWMIQSSAYGDEDRLPLRPPVAAGTAAVVAWVIWAACLVGGPLALAARSWALGGVATALAVAGGVYLAPRWHRLALRWLVFVPAGIVLHDPVVLADTLMVRTAQIDGVRLAPLDTGAIDLTGPASGYALEIATRDTVTTVLAFTPREPDGRVIHMTAMLVAPSRPGSALATAAQRGLPVG